MTIRAPHLQDDRLLDCYVAARHGEALAPPIAEHLTDCDVCGTRYADIAQFMDDLRGEGQTEADAVFTPERLLAQRQQIARRIEHVGRAAHVINFPRKFVNRTMTASSSHTAPRWIASAAAAGLFLGLALGSYNVDWRARAARSLSSAASTTAPRPASFTPPAPPHGAPAPHATSDDAFLSELEVVLDRPHASELQPFDILTPHVREIRDLR